MAKIFILIGCICGALGVLIGAFGAHALKQTLEATGRLDTFETGVKYQLYHALALILLGILFQKEGDNTSFEWAGWMFLGGVVLFSGSLFVLSLTGITWLGAITPIGGIGFIGGWLFMALGVMKAYQQH